MKHMKLSKAERKLDTAQPAAPMKDEYPYGLRIRLGKDELEKLGIKELPAVGSVFEFDAKATVESVSSHTGKENSDRSVEFQITHLDLEENEEVKSKKTSRALYPTMEKKGN